jgi:alpha-beta hydrolase superfamily lysophospholipase
LARVKKIFVFFLAALGTGLLLLLVLLGLMAFAPMSPPALLPDIRPTAHFHDAMEEIDKLRREIPPQVREECRGMVIDHGRKTERVYVLMHGLTNCPAQFQKFGELLHGQGANVVIPRLPYHGLEDGLDDKQIFITAENMIAVGQHAVNLAHGLGEEVCVVGLSVNGTVAAWLAQNRPDIHTSMVIAPFLAPPGLPAWAIAPLTRIIGRLPNSLVWWDPRLRETLEGPNHAYRRFATHSLAWVMAIGLTTFRESAQAPPAAGRVIMVNSASDRAISLPRAESLAANWAARAPEKLTEFVFPLEQRVPHDAIDPSQPDAAVDVVYPELLRLLASTCAPRDSNPEPKD